jgi:hypothetical protein
VKRYKIQKDKRLSNLLLFTFFSSVFSVVYVFATHALEGEQPFIIV